MVLPIDEPSDALYRLITHELTHIFEFDIIPRTLLRRGLPLWVDEGLADYETGYWNPFDLMTVRDAAIADIVPPMSDFQGAPFDAAACPTTSVTRRSSSSSRGGARKGCGSSSSRCARASSAAATAPTRKRSS